MSSARKTDEIVILPRREDNGKAEVSILCTTFNHEKYIEKTIASLVNQQTEFNYEIVIHDDASTDRTQELLKRAQSRYPNLLTLVLQRENQFSKKHFKPMLYVSKFAKGKTYMLCEGDDYWISSCKLQWQYTNYLKHQNVDMVFHPAYAETPEGSRSIVNRHSDMPYLFSTNRVIRGTGGFCPTSSILISASVFRRLPQELTETMPCSDAFFQIYGATSGGALYLPHAYSVYSLNSASSVSDALNNASKKKQIEFNQAMSKSYKIARFDLSFLHSLSLYKMERKYAKKAMRLLNS